MAVVNLTDRPKSVCNRYVIEPMDDVFCVLTLILRFFVDVEVFIIRLSQILPINKKCHIQFSQIFPFTFRTRSS